MKSEAASPAAVKLSLCPVDAARNVVIGGSGCGEEVVIDKSFTGAQALGKITIESDGKLVVPRVFDALEVHTKGIVVKGLMSLGTAVCPIGLENPASKLKLVFTGNASDAAPSNMPNGSGSDKGIEVQENGILRMYGAKGVAPKAVSWTFLSRPAGPVKYQDKDAAKKPVEAGGESTLHLAQNVTTGPGAWRVNDWIVVATSSFSPFESEFVQIASISANGSGGTDLTLRNKLRHYHFGSDDPGVPSADNFGAGEATNYGVDERSEVGLISRNITLTSETPNPATAPNDINLHWGGEIRVLQGFKETSIQGVELEKFGKERLGSYPIHFHMVGDASGRTLINSNSIHHSYNKCITVHSSSDITFQNNVCARAVGHLFYEEMGDETKISFINNLGLGAMSNQFGIDSASVRKADDGSNMPKNWWEGDNLARANGYDGLNIRNTDNRASPTHGGCYRPDPGRPGTVLDVGGNDQVVNCKDGEIYAEPATGFWIVNPATVMEGNSIGGCQGMGKGYWYVPPKNIGAIIGPDGKTILVPGTDYLEKFHPVGAFNNNRVHACYDGLFGEGEQGTSSEQPQPRVGGLNSGNSLIAHFNGLTATRIRNRGVWIRPVWNAVENGRFATNRDSATLVSSGGPDGNAPGVWALLQDSVFVGVSNNNVDRWGPCPTTTDAENPGCVDYNPKANELSDKRYQTPNWNSAGYMIYDGPVRILHNHFVNFLSDPSKLLTKADADLMRDFTSYSKPKAKRYEGDAALGWFQSNQSAYPTATSVRELSFDNVNLRHQIYTSEVNPSGFRDGDMNTAIIDLDGSLTGYRVVGPAGEPAPGQYPVSLNNLPFNRASNAADECLATGQQDEDLEGRPTSIISPANMATLEFEALYPIHPNPGNPTHWQDMVFAKNSMDNGAYQSMTLAGRNGQGIWEPKVASGFGYQVQSADSSSDLKGDTPANNGMPNIVRVGLTDAVKPDMDKAGKQFYVRLGIRYVNQTGTPLSASNFTITRGFKSWGGNAFYIDPTDLTIRKYFTQLININGQTCLDLDDAHSATKGLYNNFGPNGCPANGVMATPDGGKCLDGSVDDGSGKFCVFKKKPLTSVTDIRDLTKTDGTPDGDKYYFDVLNGMLFFYVQQDFKNAHAVFPLGSCPGDAACPGANELDTYFPCPPQGCVNYSVVVDNTYTPGKSGAMVDPGTFPLAPQNQNKLAYVGGGVVDSQPLISSKGMPHWAPAQSPSCPTSTAPVATKSASYTGKAPVPTKLASAKFWLGSAVSNAELSTPSWLRFTGRTAVADIRALGAGPVCTASPFQLR